MKYLISLLAVALSCQLFAQEGGAQTRNNDPAAIEEFSRHISGRDSPELIDNTDALLGVSTVLLELGKTPVLLADFLKNSVGLVDVDVTAFTAALEDIKASNEKASSDELASLCADPQRGSLSMAQLAERTNRMQTSQTARMRQEVMSKLTSAIGTENYNQLALWVESEKEDTTRTEVDVMAYLEARGDDAQQTLSLMCRAHSVAKGSNP